ncbi:TetR/AcrR family transcriptional regulator C-terminal domain-containing protein [Actinocrispum wychmicini]|uniref:TetR family transcriptional regulator n=1 Tax=Actinocrispum wychmicini TaxID=1213861 RepID=A0A4R2JZJ3_9PSEU|nr:TetR/AcrR family transcriptional regulator C-terminal domain-containing protein [Actinocrispum wychmicini]TCO64722.1 TetR family transcriptional regulator [Actinocrispum wychmicini]
MSRRDEVLQAALDLLDEVGLDSLTTRRLAERLGVRPGALYRHFDSKRALLDAMVDVVIGGGSEVDDGPPQPTKDTWDEQIRTIATGARAAMLTHRDGARLVVTHLLPGPRAEPGVAQLAWETMLTILRPTGLSEAGAAGVIDTIFAYVNGFTIEEQARDGFPQPAERRALRDQGFAIGLDLILTGVRAKMKSV